jgi:hypothetical protein
MKETYVDLHSVVYVTMKQSPSWEANSHSPSQEIPHL